jgi:hypothetical protein
VPCLAIGYRSPYPHLNPSNTVRHATGARGVCSFPPSGGRVGWGETVDIEATPAFTPTRTLPHQGGGRLLALRTELVPNSIDPPSKGGGIADAA